MNLERTDRVNWSTLKHILTSPKHYIHRLTHPQPDSEALIIGRALHCAVYEPQEFAARYVVSPNFHRGMNDDTARAKGYDGGKQSAAEWDAANDRREKVESDWMLRIQGMRDALLSDPVAGPLMCGGRVEHRIEWIDAETGIECRGRVDRVNGCLSDLKSTRSLQWFERDVARLMYHAQLAWYFDGLTRAGIETHEAPRLIAVESEAPFDVQVLTFEPEDLDAGRRLYRSALDTLAECRRAGVWPGMARGAARRVQLPQWAIDDHDDVELTIGGEALV